MGVDNIAAVSYTHLYKQAHQKAEQLYSDTLGWQRMSLINVANAGMFSADRAVDDYARDIWYLK